MQIYDRIKIYVKPNCPHLQSDVSFIDAFLSLIVNMYQGPIHHQESACTTY